MSYKDCDESQENPNKNKPSFRKIDANPIQQAMKKIYWRSPNSPKAVAIPTSQLAEKTPRNTRIRKSASVDADIGQFIPWVGSRDLACNTSARSGRHHEV
jgi:hypothetical protein